MLSEARPMDVDQVVSFEQKVSDESSLDDRKASVNLLTPAR
jgi:hypothetical protein